MEELRGTAGKTGDSLFTLSDFSIAELSTMPLRFCSLTGRCAASWITSERVSGVGSTPDPLEINDVEWVTPEQLAGAAGVLRELVLANDERVEPMVATYALRSNEMESAAAEEVAQDLLDVAGIAEYPRGCGVEWMTLEVNW